VGIHINQNGVINPSQGSPQDLLKSRNTEILQKLFENELMGREYSEEFNDYKIFVCSICLDTLVASLVSKLECKHVFHAHCLKDWLLKDALKPKCPNCNHPVIQSQDDSHTALINPNVEQVSIIMNPSTNVLMNPVTVVVSRPLNN
jgi:hypothetical protein